MTKKNNNTKIAKLLGILAIMWVGTTIVSYIQNLKSEERIKAKIVMIKDPKKGSCTGEQVKGASGQNYILTASHCKPLATNGEMPIITEDGRTMNRRIIQEDPNSDLLLLEGAPGIEGLPIAKNIKRGDHLRTFTHGMGLKTYKTEGYFVETQEAPIPIGLAEGPEDKCDTSQPKFKVIDVESFFGKIKLCVLDTVQMITTAQVVPGSSGGPAINDEGQLVGVVSASMGPFSSFVTLEDIKKLLNNY